MRLIAAASLAVAACGDAETATEQGASPAVAAAAASASASADADAAGQVSKSERVEAVFTGWEMGDYLWANMEVEGREASGAWVGLTPVEQFLEAHKGQPITLRLKTAQVHIPEAGGSEEIERIVEASASDVSAARWWAGLSAAEKKAAEARLGEVLAGGG